eukprot:scaffold115147_cov63-Phaeocystis_antarctica.AAC.1
MEVDINPPSSNTDSSSGRCRAASQSTPSLLCQMAPNARSWPKGIGILPFRGQSLPILSVYLDID